MLKRLLEYSGQFSPKDLGKVTFSMDFEQKVEFL